MIPDWKTLAWMEFDLMEHHVDYPHQPGTLYDCPACEDECNCDSAAGFDCVGCAVRAEDGCPVCLSACPADVDCPTFRARQG